MGKVYNRLRCVKCGRDRCFTADVRDEDTMTMGTCPATRAPTALMPLDLAMTFCICISVPSVRVCDNEKSPRRGISKGGNVESSTRCDPRDPRNNLDWNVREEDRVDATGPRRDWVVVGTATCVSADREASNLILGDGP